MKFSMTGQEKGVLLIQVTTWAGLTVFFLFTVSSHLGIQVHKNIHHLSRISLH